MKRVIEKPLTIHFSKSNIEVTGDNQQLLLDQAETRGLTFPILAEAGNVAAVRQSY